MVDKTSFSDQPARRDYRNAEERARDDETSTRGSFSATAGRLAAFSDRAARAVEQTLTPPSSLKNNSADAETAASYDDNQPDDQDDGTRLWRVLKRSAHTIAMRSRRLGLSATKVFHSLEERREGDVVFTAQFIRIVLALTLGGGLALWFDRSVIEARIAGADTLSSAGLAAGMPLADAVVFIKVYGYAALGGAAFAVAGLIPALFLGQLTNEKHLGRAEQMGVAIAEMLKRINETLAGHRAALEERAMNADAVQTEVSRAHIAAEEAALLFQEVDFLIYEPREGGLLNRPTDGAQRSFEDYLLNASITPRPRRGALGAWLVGVLFGGFVATVFCVVSLASIIKSSLATPAEALGAPSDLILLGYPQHLAIVAGGVLVYLAAGIFARPLADALMFGARKARSAAALTAVRGAVTSAEAPNAKDIALQVEALNAIFQERIAASRSKATLTGAGPRRDHTYADETQSSILASAAAAPAPSTWRADGDANRRFVDSGFQAAPKQWFAGPDGRSESRPSEKKKRFFS
ncbi:MAG: hypothetical protein AAF224_13360 [Pseudomonadota bacterium]